MQSDYVTLAVVYFTVLASFGLCYLAMIMLLYRTITRWWLSVLTILVDFFMICRLFSFQSTEKLSVHLAMLMLILLTAMITQIIILFASFYKKFGIYVGGKLVETAGPLDCLYLSIVTWTTVGYGDVVPSPRSRPIAAAEALTGYLCMALIVAALLKLLGG